MKSGLIFGAAIIAAVATAPRAHAQDWNGGYIGLRSDYVTDGVVDYQNTGTPEQNLTGSLMGAQGGYDVSWGAFMAGVAVDGVWGNLKDELADGNEIHESGRLSSQRSLRLRVGLHTRHALFYVTGGKTQAELEQGETCPDPATAPFGFCRPAAGHAPFNLHQSHTIDGTTFGGGIELAISEHWTLGVEARMNDYDDETYVLSPDASGHPLPASVADFDSKQIGFSINWRP